ncbi:SMI1/KNR4 family protein, partial [uncultured Aquimarina sp.]|uniref:SMI1/KNR4 family protein n=1 Tax=uncultured Aquimarina sp. TaxID=575652 RepID=UPI00262026DD
VSNQCAKKTKSRVTFCPATTHILNVGSKSKKMSKKEIYEYVDKSLSSLKNENWMFIPHSNMPPEMIDNDVKQKSDRIPWKAISSKVTDEDILELENQIGHKYPELYKDFLKYKHFYELENIAEIRFFKHCVRDWKTTLTEYYFNYWEPEELIKKGFIPFADYSDWGIVCFDTNRMNNKDCPIVMFDHETLYDEPVSFEELYNDFKSMARELLNELNEQ